MTSAVSERDPLPARPHDFRGGAEAGVEVHGRFQRPDDGVERNDLDAPWRFQPAYAIVHSRRMPEASLSLEPANGPGDRMRASGATEVRLGIEDRHPGGVSGERPEHSLRTISAGGRRCHRASASSHPLHFPCVPLSQSPRALGAGRQSRRGIVATTYCFSRRFANSEARQLRRDPSSSRAMIGRWPAVIVPGKRDGVGRRRLRRRGEEAR
jgi:hypothetical protein